ncbi:uncharacterized protein Z518_02445 [Rhinocladiella mackenziei CBS 650.93]|uniref:ABC multidrug transporter MDR2 n=1 Tax=Rhinocladiella mackenziei CBS 650.93 TaxID=1442369 RepID=A0A0D2IWN1_9EURO|nr:uncharacterized protein Z518_02445 [Rhinocladiella mackenziei CBS 650.93]KIX07791.1 hypothetical protein Z518_02445 [Rhinocladiella mackenziei CBS 650.93]
MVADRSEGGESPGAVATDQMALNKTPGLFGYLRLLLYAGSTWQDVGLMLIGGICAAASGVPFPLMAILFGELVNDINEVSCEVGETGTAQSYEATINDKVLQLVYIATAAFALIFIYVVCWSLLSQRVAYRLREDYFQNLLRQDQAFIDRHQAGEVSSRLNGDIQAVQSGICEKVGIFIAGLSFFVAAYVVAFIKEARLAGMLISLVPAFLLVAIVGGGFFQKFSSRMSDAVISASCIASEMLSNFTVVKAFDAGPRLEKKFAQHMAQSRREGIKKGIVAGIQAGMLYFIAYSANALAFWQGSHMITEMLAGRGDGSTLGEIYTVVFILVDACVVLGSTAPLLPIFGTAATAFEKLKKDIDHKSQIEGTSDVGHVVSPDSPGTIKFHNVSFAYPSRPEESVLRNINITFRGGKHTAIVGPSGSGKSTIAALITRLYDPMEGDITFDDHSLSDINIRSLRGFCGLVQQEPVLLNGEILQNIALGLAGSSAPSHRKFKNELLGPRLAEMAKEETDPTNSTLSHSLLTSEILHLVQQAANLADADTFIQRLDRGYNTLVGSGGQSISGGQRQRIALARALIRNPKVLILDEATASLDSSSEQRIQAAINQIVGSRTVISITHRLSTIKTADNIIVMKGGEVIDQGTYDELMARVGVFADMVKLQALDASHPGPPSNAQSNSGSRNSSLALSSEMADTSHGIDSGSIHSLHDTLPPDRETAEDEHDASKLRDIDLDSSLSPGIVIKGMGRYTRPNLIWLAMAVVAAIIVGCTFSASGLIFGHTVDALSPCSVNIDRILFLGRFFGGMLFMLAAVEFLANWISWSSFGIVAERLLYTMRVLTFRSLLEQNIEWHQSVSRPPSSLLSVITKDSAAIGGFSGSTIGTILSILVNFLVAIILSHIVAWKIAIACLTMVPILLGSGFMQLYSISRFEERNSQAFTEAVGICTEAVTSFKTVATFSLEREVMGTYRRALSNPRKEILAASIYTNFWLAIANCTGFFVYAFAYWWGSHLIIKGENSQQQFFIILVAMLVSAQLWGQMFTLAPEISRARASASRILSLIGASSRQDELPSFTVPEQSTSTIHASDVEKVAAVDVMTSLGPLRGAGVAFRSVSFSYPSSPSTLVLEDVSFSVQPGQFCGLVGPSGAGKSTIISLIQHMYESSSGSVEIDGVNVSHRDFRDDIAVVPQDHALFSGTIKFNVGLGAKRGHEATGVEIKEACELAKIHDTIMALPQQYDTECGPSGSQLSGGQRQRLTIARALIRKPRILLLDESTSALDAETEHALQDSLDRSIRGSGITVIAITHRLHTVTKADVIFVVEGGRIVDSGSHAELVQRCESYRINAQQQMLR